MRIDEASPAQFAPIARLTVAAYEALLGADALHDYRRQLEDVQGRAAGGTVLVATDDDGSLLGAVLYVPDATSAMSEFDDDDACGIRMLAVDPSCQHRGVGRALVEACLARGRHDARRRVVLHSTPAMVVARALYERLGFERAPSRDVQPQRRRGARRRAAAPDGLRAGCSATVAWRHIPSSRSSDPAGSLRARLATPSIRCNDGASCRDSLVHTTQGGTVKTLLKLAVGAGTVLGLTTALAPIAGAQVRHGEHRGDRGGHVVYVQTDNIAGNQVVSYDRAPGGSLTWSASSATGGLGGVLNGSVVDHLASQGSLDADANNGLLFAVNAGSNSVSVFSTWGGGLQLRQVIGSGGTFPNSVTSFGNLVYVLNAENGGSVSGFWQFGGRLYAIPGSTRALGLTTPADTTQFTHTPGQVAFSPDGRQLVVTTKATTNAIDVFSVRPDGRLSAAPTVNVEGSTVPFAVSFDERATSWSRTPGPTRSPRTRSAGPGPRRCSTRSARARWRPAGSPRRTATPSRRTPAARRSPPSSRAGMASSSLGNTATDPGTVDAAATPDGRYLYVQTGLNGIVDGFRVGDDGSLSSVGSVKVPGAIGAEGIVAS